MKNKKAGHVGMILSFTIFIGFILFLFAVLNPFSYDSEGKDFTLDFTFNKVFNYLSSNVTIVDFIANGKLSGGDNCSKVDSSSFGASGMFFIVKDISGNIIPASVNGDFLNVFNDAESSIFTKIYYSPESFNIYSTTQSNCSNGVVKSVVFDKYVFESRIDDLVYNYEYRYEDLREEFEVPTGVNFDFGFEFVNGSYIVGSGKDVSQEIFLREKIIQYINFDGDIVSGILRVRIW